MKTKQFFAASILACIVSIFSVNLAYGYPWISPYAFALNNPMRYVDPDGREVRVYDYENDQRIAYTWKQHEGNWGFYNSNNDLYAGQNAFIGQLSGALTGLMNGGQAGYDLVSGLANHSNVVTVMNHPTSVTDRNNNMVGWNPTGIIPDGSGLEDVRTTAGLDNNPMMNLGHELGHVEYNWSGGETRTWFNMPTSDTESRNIPISEIHTTHRENQMRSEHGLPLRTHYGKDQFGNGMGPTIIRPSVGASRYYNAQGITNYRPVGRKVTPYIY